MKKLLKTLGIAFMAFCMFGCSQGNGGSSESPASNPTNICKVSYGQTNKYTARSAEAPDYVTVSYFQVKKEGGQYGPDWEHSTQIGQLTVEKGDAKTIDFEIPEDSFLAVSCEEHPFPTTRYDHKYCELNFLEYEGQIIPQVVNMNTTDDFEPTLFYCRKQVAGPKWSVELQDSDYNFILYHFDENETLAKKFFEENYGDVLTLLWWNPADNGWQSSWYYTSYEVVTDNVNNKATQKYKDKVIELLEENPSINSIYVLFQSPIDNSIYLATATRNDEDVVIYWKKVTVTTRQQ